jgi:hypothetical protein
VDQLALPAIAIPLTTPPVAVLMPCKRELRPSPLGDRDAAQARNPLRSAARFEHQGICPKRGEFATMIGKAPPSIIITLLFAVTSVCSAEQKIDIKGFYPGMDVRLIKPPIGFRCDFTFPRSQILYQIGCSNQAGDSHERFEIKITDVLDPAVVWRVTYLFQAQTDFDTLVDQISTTYNSPATGVRTIRDDEITEILRDMWFRNGFIVWNLVDKVYLALTKWQDNVPLPEPHSNLNAPMWILTVWDNNLVEKNEVARQTASKQLAPSPLAPSPAVPNSSPASSKTDILGFKTGTTIEELMAKVAADKLSCGYLKTTDDWGNTFICFPNQTNRNENLRFAFTKTLQPNVVRQIRYQFQNGSIPADMAASVVDQFKPKRETNRPFGGLTEWEYDLDGGLRLDLVKTARPGDPADNWEMSLENPRLQQLDQQEAIEKQRRANPPRRF